MKNLKNEVEVIINQLDLTYSLFIYLIDGESCDIDLLKINSEFEQYNYKIDKIIIRNIIKN